MTPQTSSLSAFRHPLYKRLWFASMSSHFGGLIQAVGASWMMTTLTDSEALIALVQASVTLPIMLLSLVSGALADNFDRRRIMITAQVFMLSVSVLLAIVTWSGWLTPWLLLTFTLLIGCGTALNNPSLQASVGEIVPREDLPSAVTLNSMGFNLARSVGPALGGFIVAAFGAAAAFAINAVSYLPVIFALLFWRPQRKPRTLPPERLAGAIGSGLRYVSMSPNIMKIYSRAFLFGLASVAAMALLPAIAKFRLGGDATTLGFMFGAFGIGAIGGGLLNAKVRSKFENESIVRLNSIIMAIAMAILSSISALWMALAVLPFMGAAWVMSLSLFNVSVQLSTPRWVVGRALSLYQTAAFGGMASGAWLWGYIAETNSSAVAFLAASATLLLNAGIGLLYRLPDFSQDNFDPVHEFRAPTSDLDLRPRSGPVFIMVEYQISADNTEQFISLMHERRRIRRRDGAKNWSLLRDIETPTIWREKYRVPTWADYIRFVERRTQADLANIRAARALHEGDGLPKVTRLVERDASHPEDFPTMRIRGDMM